MGVYGYVGLTGSGKTRRLVRALLEDLSIGREVWANFQLGGRHDGWMVPLCGTSLHYAEDHVAERYEFRPTTALLEVVGREKGWRRGVGFKPTPQHNLLVGGWEQLMELRVFRDEMDRAHRCELRQNAVGEWKAERACLVYDCSGCSKGLTVGIDELNQWAPAREWAKLGPGVLNRLAYVRKDSIDLHWSAQHERRIDTVPRELTEYILSCSMYGLGVRADGRPALSILGRGVRFQIARREKWIPALMTDKNRVVTGEGASGGGFKGGELEFVIRFGKNLMTKEEWSYNTFEHVAPAAGLEARREAKPASAAVVSLDQRRASSTPPRTYEGRGPARGDPKGRNEVKQSGGAGLPPA